ncbi:SulA-like leucine-rich domain-containing protein [Endozoicomonadaceae bacterium StTr2]
MQFHGTRTEQQQLIAGRRNPFSSASRQPALRSHQQSREETCNKALYNSGKVSEIVLPLDLAQPSGLLEPLLSHLADNHDSRWLTVVSSRQEAAQVTRWMRSSSIDGSRVICLAADNNEDALELSSRALASGTSHTVVSWFLALEEHGVLQLEQAARQGASQGLAIRSR